MLATDGGAPVYADLVLEHKLVLTSSDACTNQLAAPRHGHWERGQHRKRHRWPPRQRVTYLHRHAEPGGDTQVSVELSVPIAVELGMDSCIFFYRV